MGEGEVGSEKREGGREGGEGERAVIGQSGK